MQISKHGKVRFSKSLFLTIIFRKDNEGMNVFVTYIGELSWGSLTADGLPGVVSLVCCWSLLLLAFSGVMSEVKSAECPDFVWVLSVFASLLGLDDCGGLTYHYTSCGFTHKKNNNTPTNKTETTFVCNHINLQDRYRIINKKKYMQ